MDFTKKSVMVMLVVIFSIFLAFFTFEGNMLTGAFIGIQEINIENIPSITLVLNTTNLAKNDTNVNLTAYNTTQANGTSLKIIYNWLRNNTPIAVLNMPFEGINNTATNNSWDYSGYGNNGKDQGTILWNASGGYDGKGAYMFNSTDSHYILINDSPSIKSACNNGCTFVSWVNKNPKPSAISLIMARMDNALIEPPGDDDDDLFALRASGTDVLTFLIGNGSTTCTATGGNISLNNWNHVVGRYNGTHTATFVNGTQQAATACTFSAINPTSWDISDEDILIGASDDDAPALFWNGTIDEVIIFNRSLSAEQIYALWQNQTNIIVAQETVLGENWSVQATPNNRTGDGNIVISNNVTILDRTPPSVTVFPLAKNLTSRDSSIQATVNDSENLMNVTFEYSNGTTPFNRTPTQTISHAGGGTFVYSFSDLHSLIEGTTRVTIVANDSAGNINNTEYANITVDYTPPNVTFITPQAGENIASHYTFRARVTENHTSVDTVLFLFSNGSFPFNETASNNSGIWYLSYNTALFQEGSITVTVWANDSIFNNVNNSVSISVTVDNVAEAGAGTGGGGGSSSSSTTTSSTPATSPPAQESPLSSRGTASSSETSESFRSGRSSIDLTRTGERELTEYTTEENYIITITNNLNKRMLLSGALKEQEQPLENEENALKRIQEEQGNLDPEALENELRILKLLENVEVLQVYRTKLSRLLPPSLTGAVTIPLIPTGKHIEANLLRDILLNYDELQNIEVDPGETVKKEVRISKGLQLDRDEPLQIIFSSSGEPVLVKEIDDEKLTTGTAVDIDPENKKLDFYVVIAPEPGMGKETFTVEININTKRAKRAAAVNIIPLKTTLPFFFNSDTQSIFSELFGPYTVDLEKGALLAVQYDASFLPTEYEIVGKIYKRGVELVAENRFDVRQS